MLFPSIRSRTCPKCGHHTFRRSHYRGIVERGLSKLIVPCRCYGCDYRYFRPRWAVPEETSSTSHVKEVSKT
jgi:hypothetical protein